MPDSDFPPDPPPVKARRVDLRPDDNDDGDERPRRRPRRRRSMADDTGGLIPYKNENALLAYYLGVFGLVPCLGAPLSVAAIVCGLKGLKHAKRYPESAGTVHAWVGIVLGSVELAVTILIPVAVVVFAAVSK